MSRLTSLLMAATVASAVVGCAHCDTCDDFPAPCTDCGYNAATPAAGAPMMADGTIMDPSFAPGMPPGAPITTPGSPIVNSSPAINAAPAPPAAPGIGSAPPIDANNDLPGIPPLPNASSPF